MREANCREILKAENLIALWKHPSTRDRVGAKKNITRYIRRLSCVYSSFWLYAPSCQPARKRKDRSVIKARKRLYFPVPALRAWPYAISGQHLCRGAFPILSSCPMTRPLGMLALDRAAFGKPKMPEPLGHHFLTDSHLIPSDRSPLTQIMSTPSGLGPAKTMAGVILRLAMASIAQRMVVSRGKIWG